LVIVSKTIGIKVRVYSLAAGACLLSLGACGPMNGVQPPAAPAADTGCNGGGQTDATGAPIAMNLSHNHAFAVLARSTPPQQQDTPQGTQYTVNYTVRLTHADLSGLSKTATITAVYKKSTTVQTGKPPSPVTLTSQDDGSYTFSLTLRRSGSYEIDFTITDGSVTDTHVIPFTI
jgi:hypothetical protein